MITFTQFNFWKDGKNCDDFMLVLKILNVISKKKKKVKRVLRANFKYRKMN